jgi:uncharacterized protein (TIGR01777 family)
MIGTPLVAALKAAGHQPIRVVRRPPKADEIQWDPASDKIDAAGLEGIDAVVNLAGQPLAPKRWNDAYRKEIVDSRVKGTTLIAKTLAGAQNGPKRLLNGSAIGIYGDRGDELLDESSSPGTGFVADLVQKWEAATQPAIEAGISAAMLRTGIVLHPKGGALQKLLPLFKLGLGGKFGSGRQYMSWITLADEVDAIVHLLTSQATGPFNLTAPNPATNLQLTKTLGKVLRRPTIMAVPEFAPKLIVGPDTAQAMLFDSARILPKAIQADGFSFKQPEIETALRHVLKR